MKYILSGEAIKVWLRRRKLSKDVLSNDLYTRIPALCELYQLTVKIDKLVGERHSRIVTPYRNIGILLHDVRTLHNKCVSKNRGDKYYSELPASMIMDSDAVLFDKFFTIDGSFVSESECVEELRQLFTEIKEEIHKDYNEDFKTYYTSKVGRVFRHVEHILNTLLK